MEGGTGEAIQGDDIEQSKAFGIANAACLSRRKRVVLASLMRLDDAVEKAKVTAGLAAAESRLQGREKSAS